MKLFMLIYSLSKFKYSLIYEYYHKKECSGCKRIETVAKYQKKRLKYLHNKRKVKK